MRYVVHETPSLLPLEAFTLFGASSKPNSKSPIGYFGTGLKYAMAVLARHKCPVSIFIGETEYRFGADLRKFREKDIMQMIMRRQVGRLGSWRAQTLPYTTELGKNWELWMAFRELHANTLDENGYTYTSYGKEVGISGKTRIVIGDDAYLQVACDLDQIFLPKEEQKLHETILIECREGASEWAFYRGLRVSKLQQKSMYTWNLLMAELTEDRTLKYSFIIESYARNLVKTSHDRDFIKSIFKAKEGTFESTFDFSILSDDVSPEFIDTARQYGNRSAIRFIAAYDTEHPTDTSPSIDWRIELSKALEHGDDELIVKSVKKHRASLLTLLRKSMREDTTTIAQPIAISSTSGTNSALPF